MNNVEAKFVLRSYRPNGADAADETFASALAQAQRDPELRQWFEREQAADGAVAAKFSQVQPPAGLREAILAGGRATGSNVAQKKRAWGRSAWMAMAASVALVGAVGLAFWPKKAEARAAFSDFVLTDAAASKTHGGHGGATSGLQVMLGQPGVRAGMTLPVDFETLRLTGCRTVEFRGHDVLEVCFNRNGVWFHCYIARRADAVKLIAGEGLSVIDHAGIGVASWADAAHVYVIVSKTGRAALENLL
ncbi:hypothetical protein [Oleiharenicola lentus]|uniref:hypothetical protein n=1 Tax=Oleiharenicola lentus TaxID=2508720 RepID=UPI003F662B38